MGLHSKTVWAKSWMSKWTQVKEWEEKSELTDTHPPKVKKCDFRQYSYQTNTVITA